MTRGEMLGMIMCQFQEWMRTAKIVHGKQYIGTYILKKGIENFSKQGRKTAYNKIKQVIEQKCNRCQDNELYRKERSLESSIFLTQKKDTTIKAWQCANGSTHQSYIS